MHFIDSLRLWIFISNIFGCHFDRRNLRCPRAQSIVQPSLYNKTQSIIRTEIGSSTPIHARILILTKRVCTFTRFTSHTPSTQLPHETATKLLLARIALHYAFLMVLGQKMCLCARTPHSTLLLMLNSAFVVHMAQNL